VTEGEEKEERGEGSLVNLKSFSPQLQQTSFPSHLSLLVSEEMSLNLSAAGDLEELYDLFLQGEDLNACNHVSLLSFA
jgi:hypothetical protein